VASSRSPGRIWGFAARGGPRQQTPVSSHQFPGFTPSPRSPTTGSQEFFGLRDRGGGCRAACGISERADVDIYTALIGWLGAQAGGDDPGVNRWTEAAWRRSLCDVLRERSMRRTPASGGPPSRKICDSRLPASIITRRWTGEIENALLRDTLGELLLRKLCLLRPTAPTVRSRDIRAPPCVRAMRHATPSNSGRTSCRGGAAHQHSTTPRTGVRRPEQSQFAGPRRHLRADRVARVVGDGLCGGTAGPAPAARLSRRFPAYRSASYR